MILLIESMYYQMLSFFIIFGVEIFANIDHLDPPVDFDRRLLRGKSQISPMFHRMAVMAGKLSVGRDLVLCLNITEATDSLQKNTVLFSPNAF